MFREYTGLRFAHWRKVKPLDLSRCGSKKSDWPHQRTVTVLRQRGLLRRENDCKQKVRKNPCGERSKNLKKRYFRGVLLVINGKRAIRSKKLGKSITHWASLRKHSHTSNKLYGSVRGNIAGN